MYSLVYAISMCELQKIFFLRDMMDNQCANILSTQCNCLQVTQCRVCIFLKERIFFLHVYPQLSFFFLKTWFVSFYLSLPPLFFSKTVFPKTCFVFPIFIGGEIFFNLCGSQGELSLFCLTLLHIFSVYLLIRQSLSIRDKKGETQMTCLFCLGENKIVFQRGRI